MGRVTVTRLSTASHCKHKTGVLDQAGPGWTVRPKQPRSQDRTGESARGREPNSSFYVLHDMGRAGVLLVQLRGVHGIGWVAESAGSDGG